MNTRSKARQLSLYVDHTRYNTVEPFVNNDIIHIIRIMRITRTNTLSFRAGQRAELARREAAPSHIASSLVGAVLVGWSDTPRCLNNSDFEQ